MRRPVHRLRQRVRTRATALVASAALLTGGLVAATATPASAAVSLAGHWALDEGSGTTAADSSGAGHDATLGSGADWTSGQVGSGAVTVNGTASGSVDVPSPVVDTSGSFTVSAWVKLNKVSGYQTVVSADGTNISGYYLQLNGTTGKGTFTRRASDSTSAAEVRTDSKAVPAANTWYHLVGVDDGTAGTLTLYVDGRHRARARSPEPGRPPVTRASARHCGAERQRTSSTAPWTTYGCTPAS
ncbi:LamG domain-containing protein [Streptomyces sp. NPDC101152]|uniref:LamG domain-containing protein n=1 Tax=Streptomyces sp. NPDC101152 TaxID=3366116 RepID=UPI00381D16AC